MVFIFGSKQVNKVKHVHRGKEALKVGQVKG